MNMHLFHIGKYLQYNYTDEEFEQDEFAFIPYCKIFTI